MYSSYKPFIISDILFVNIFISPEYFISISTFQSQKLSKVSLSLSLLWDSFFSKPILFSKTESLQLPLRAFSFIFSLSNTLSSTPSCLFDILVSRIHSVPTATTVSFGLISALHSSLVFMSSFLSSPVP